MKITAKQSLATKAAAKDRDGRPILATVNVTSLDNKTTVVATDSYRLVAITAPVVQDDATAIYDAEVVNIQAKVAKLTKAQHVDLEQTSALEQYPKWEQIKPDITDFHKVRLDRKLLIELLQVIDSSVVEIAIGDNKQYKPMVLTATEDEHEYYGLLMPMRH